MSDDPAIYTETDLKEFRRLVLQAESLNQLSRISARLDMPKFIEKHGEAKCDAMFEILKKETP